MKDLFWRSVLGIFLLLIISAVSLNVGEFIQETEAVSGSRGIIRGMETIFKKMGGKKEGKRQVVVVLDAGHGGGWNRPKIICFMGGSSGFLPPVESG